MRIPIPTYEELEKIPAGTNESYEWIRWYIDVPPWKCVECGTKMFGRMEYCSYCKLRSGILRKRETQ